MTTFIWGDIQIRIKDGFSILLPAADAVRLFGENLKLSCIVAVPQAHRRPRLILNLKAKLEGGMSSVNDTTDSEAVLESLKFCGAFPHIIQAVWEANPAQGLVHVSKLNATDAYHCGTVTPFQFGAFSYVVPSAPGD